MSQIDERLLPISKLRSLEEATRLRLELRRQGRSVVLTNGCFDLLHTGHIFFLQQARREGDALFIVLNSDASVRALKGPRRPIQPELERTYCLAALECVNTIVIFDQPRLVAEIRALRPDVYVKAGDYSLESLDTTERAALEEVGAEIRFLPYLPGVSTTALLKRLNPL